MYTDRFFTRPPDFVLFPWLSSAAVAEIDAIFEEHNEKWRSETAGKIARGEVEPSEKQLFWMELVFRLDWVWKGYMKPEYVTDYINEQSALIDRLYPPTEQETPE